MLSDFYYGVFLHESSNNNVLASNTVNSNRFYGIIISESENNVLTSNRVCSNNQYCLKSGDPNCYDIYNNKPNRGSENTCDNNKAWNDVGITGCTHKCGESEVIDLCLNKKCLSFSHCDQKTGECVCDEGYKNCIGICIPKDLCCFDTDCGIGKVCDNNHCCDKDNIWNGVKCVSPPEVLDLVIVPINYNFQNERGLYEDMANKIKDFWIEKSPFNECRAPERRVRIHLLNNDCDEAVNSCANKLCSSDCQNTVRKCAFDSGYKGLYDKILGVYKGISTNSGGCTLKGMNDVSVAYEKYCQDNDCTESGMLSVHELGHQFGLCDEAYGVCKDSKDGCGSGYQECYDFVKQGGLCEGKQHELTSDTCNKGVSCKDSNPLCSDCCPNPPNKECIMYAQLHPKGFSPECTKYLKSELQSYLEGC